MYMTEPQKQLVLPALTDGDWRELKKLSRLPDSARKEIENIIRFLRDDPPNQKPWSAMMQDARLAMQDARIKLKQAIKSLRRLSKTEAPTFMQKLHPVGGNVTGWLESPRPKIDVAIEAMEDLLSFFPPDENTPPTFTVS